jgi:hypothetical protein
MAAVADTEAQVALASGDIAGALRLAADAQDYAKRSGNELARLAAMLTEARAMRVDGQLAEAEGKFAAAAALARTSRVPNRLREVLGEWADLRANSGDHRGAYELTSEALTVN